MSALPFARQLHVLDRTDSTNEEARRLAAGGAPEGTVVIARSQTSGRGRLGRSWHSPEGRGLYMSVLLRPEEPLDRIGRYGLAAALATVEACRALGAAGARIKWPNDVLADRGKLAGILAETRSAGSGTELVLGFGVNVLHEPEDFPPEIRALATSLRIETGTAADLTSVAAALLEALDGWTRRLREGSWEELRASFVRDAPGVTDTPVRLSGGGRGTTRGLDVSGALRVATAEGILLVHASDSVTSWGA